MPYFVLRASFISLIKSLTCCNLLDFGERKNFLSLREWVVRCFLLLFTISLPITVHASVMPFVNIPIFAIIIYLFIYLLCVKLLVCMFDLRVRGFLGVKSILVILELRAFW